MYTLLIVDDEMIAVKAIASGIDWSGLPISSIYEAYDYDEAVELLTNHSIDILITDIEMPGKSGLHLLEFVHQHYPDLATIITTGHANFDYAQKAIKHGSLHYLLKPLDFSELKGLVTNALMKINEMKKVKQYTADYDTYQKQWNQQLPILRERFWQDLINERSSVAQDKLQAAAELYHIPVTEDMHVLPILISVEQWQAALTTRDEEILEYALRNAADELLLGTYPGQILQERHGSNVALLFFERLEDCSSLFTSEMTERCTKYIQQCRTYFRVNLSCYIGEAVPIPSVSAMFRELILMEKNNLTKHQTVLYYRDHKENHSESRLTLPPYTEWQTLVETRKKNDLIERIHLWFDGMLEESATPQSLQAFYGSYLNLFYQVGINKGISSLPFDLDCNLQSALRSIPHAREWAIQVAERFFEWNEEQPNYQSSVIEAASDYIYEHLDNELSREQIAEHVHLNPAYLSRLFKKEKGISLSDFIVKVRMEKAKQLLQEPEIKISNAASSVGYTHFSHFAKMFKKVIGQTPQEYRNGYLKK
ncbi:helix-turn-helix domain-containing protein [Paenibacillus sp. MMO-177]|uniref:helix-turn-helix domain-containing protein n=1 Tax=Paenibacillus sp. MMO-177 TaxID=3081289 RepID=UPI00301A19CB